MTVAYYSVILTTLFDKKENDITDKNREIVVQQSIYQDWNFVLARFVNKKLISNARINVYLKGKIGDVVESTEDQTLVNVLPYAATIIYFWGWNALIF